MSTLQRLFLQSASLKLLEGGAKGYLPYLKFARRGRCPPDSSPPVLYNLYSIPGVWEGDLYTNQLNLVE